MIEHPIDGDKVLPGKLRRDILATTAGVILGAVHKAGGSRSLRAVMERLRLFRHPLLTNEQFDNKEFVDNEERLIEMVEEKGLGL
ncbi:hypothetical protein MCOR25_001421 [Pyricularia grisea]|uniref:Uncharacterized protein n=1 Tax=Pyricularia grisea TaxID=148305 RepID=A0A6P8AUN4_PYRGI|nr:uncharacterized protein PgNI_08687 [Pyricularia grisea]KAI6380896.1 hypothetical protein MCOR25_001421 [Pyricularia grisea]TLD05933.1 hypothetical protein PgNI_08687 [Pyricularia grisea]